MIKNLTLYYYKNDGIVLKGMTISYYLLNLHDLHVAAVRIKLSRGYDIEFYDSEGFYHLPNVNL